MNDHLYSTKYVASKLGMTDTGLRLKGISAGVLPKVHLRKHFYTEEQIEQIKNHVPIRNPAIKHEKHDEIILYWKTSKDNSAPSIARVFKIKECQVNSVLNKHLKSLKPKE